MADGRTTALSLTKKLIKLLRQNGIPVAEAYLFGSHTRDGAGKESDIDLALISESFCGIRYADITKIAVMIHEIDDRLEVHTFSPQDKEESLFLQEIITSGIKVV